MASEEISDRTVLVENANEDSDGSSSTDENGKTDADILAKVQSLYSEKRFLKPCKVRNTSFLF